MSSNQSKKQTTLPEAPSATPGKEPLNHYIFRHYARSALIPILAIELTLLAIYFAVNIYTARKSEATLRREVTAIMPHLVKKQADLINADFENIERQSGYFAQANEDLFNHPTAYSVIGEQPHFAIAPSGALYQTNRDSNSALYFTNAKALTFAQKDKARLSAALDPLYKHLVRDIPHVAAAYLNTPDNMNRIYPFIPEIYKQYPPDLNMKEFNFFYLADAKHDPLRKPVWTGVYLDPAGKGWMLSCISPVYHKDSLVGVVGLDVTTAAIVNQFLAQDLPWGATAFLADEAGMILAMSPRAETLLGLTELKEHIYNATINKEQLKPDQFNILKSKNPIIASTFKNIYTSKNNIHQIKLEGEGKLFIVGNKINATGWKLFMVTESKEVTKSVDSMTTLSHRIGFVLIAGLALFYFFFFLFLRKQAIIMSATIASPVMDIARAAKELGRGNQLQELPQSDIRELDELTLTFAQMGLQLKDNSQALIQSEVQAKIQEKETELSFAHGMYESASGYLHNVGNSITLLDSSLLDLEGIVKSTEQYPEVFEKLSNGDPAMLERFRSVLIDKMSPKIRDTVFEIRRIKETIQQTIRHQQQSFKASHDTLCPVKFDLASLISEAATTVSGSEYSVPIYLNLPDAFPLIHQRNQLHDGIVNLIKNALESCTGRSDGAVTITLTQTEQGAKLEVADNGVGIIPEHRAKIMTAGFTTKPSGNGFGLHSFAIFLSAHGGKISVESPGPDQGATVTVELFYAQL